MPAPDSVIERVRQADRDRFLATLFAPEALQPDLLALYALSAELSGIRHQVSDPMIGEIRLQWWSDSIEGIYAGELVNHPVAIALAAAIQRHGLPKAALHNMIDARRFDLYADRMPTLNDLEGYLGETVSGVIQLAAHMLDPALAAACTRQAGLAGVAYGLARIVSTGDPASKFLPNGQTLDSLAGQAMKRLNEARDLQVPQALLPAFLPATLTETYLAVRGRGPSPLRLQWRLWRAARRKSI